MVKLTYKDFSTESDHNFRGIGGAFIECDTDNNTADSRLFSRLAYDDDGDRVIEFITIAFDEDKGFTLAPVQREAVADLDIKEWNELEKAFSRI